MAGDSVCEQPGPLGSGAIVGNRPTRAACAYQVGHQGPCSWEGQPLQYVRPNGRIYRPRRPPKAFYIEGEMRCDYVLVIRTHDLHQARDLAERVAEVKEGHWKRWLRIGMRNGELEWVEDEARGMASIYFEAA